MKVICCFVEVHPLLSLWLRNSIKHNWARSRANTNHCIDESQLKSLIFQEGNNRVRHVETYVIKTIRFLSRNHRILGLSIITTIGKTATVKDLNKLEIHILFWKSKFSGSKWSKPKIDINTKVSKLARYIYQSSSCLGILRSGCLG